MKIKEEFVLKREFVIVSILLQMLSLFPFDLLLRADCFYPDRLQTANTLGSILMTINFVAAIMVRSRCLVTNARAIVSETHLFVSMKSRITLDGLSHVRNTSQTRFNEWKDAGISSNDDHSSHPTGGITHMISFTA